MSADDPRTLHRRCCHTAQTPRSSIVDDVAEWVSCQDDDWAEAADDPVLRAVRWLVLDVGERIALDEGWGTAAVPTSLELLEAARRIRERLEETTEELVAEAVRRDSATWDRIAARLGMTSKQAAHARYAQRVKQVLARWVADVPSDPESSRES